MALGMDDTGDMKTIGLILLGIFIGITVIVAVFQLLTPEMTPEQEEVREEVYQMMSKHEKISDRDANCLANRLAIQVTMDDVTSMSEKFTQAADDAATACSESLKPVTDGDRFFRFK